MNQEESCGHVTIILPLLAIVKLELRAIKTENLLVLVATDDYLGVCVFFVVFYGVLKSLGLAVNDICVEGFAFAAGSRWSSVEHALVVSLTN